MEQSEQVVAWLATLTGATTSDKTIGESWMSGIAGHTIRPLVYATPAGAAAPVEPANMLKYPIVGTMGHDFLCHLVGLMNEHPEASVNDLCRMAGIWDASAEAAAVPASEPTANERELRKMLCVAYVGVAAYMDDGEAQDNTVMPYIDFLRDAPATIRSKMRSRAWKTDATHPVRSAGG